MKRLAMAGLGVALFCGMLGIASAQSPYGGTPAKPQTKAPPSKTPDGVTVTFRNPLEENGTLPKRPGGAPLEGPKFVFGNGPSQEPTIKFPAPKTQPQTPATRYPTERYPSEGSKTETRGSYSSGSSTSSKVKVVIKKTTTKTVTEEVEIQIDAQTVTVPDAICTCAPMKLRCTPRQGSSAFLRFTCGRTIVWFVVSPNKDDEPYTIYPPFLFRMAGNNPIAQEQDWLVEYVLRTEGRDAVVWESRIRIKPERNLQPRKISVFDVNCAFEQAKIKACQPFILGVGYKQSWWGTNVPGYQNGGIQADVVVGWPLMLRFPYAGEAAFEDRHHNILGPVIVEE